MEVGGAEENGVLLRATGIPEEWVCADLRDFFAPEIARGVFSCFHYLRRPDPDGGGMCAVARLHDVACASALVAKYGGRLWSESNDKRICRLEHLHPSAIGCAPGLAAPAGEAARTDGAGVAARRERFRTRAQRREDALPGGTGIESVAASIALAELSPPAWLPRGNVASTDAQLQHAIASCRISVRVLRALGLESLLMPDGPRGAHAAVPCAYVSGRAVRAQPQPAGASSPREPCVAMAAGSLREGASVAERRSQLRVRLAADGRGDCLASLGLQHAHATGAPRAQPCAAAESEESELAEEMEEWARHEAITEPGAWEKETCPTFAYWNSENHTLFEEEIEGVWEKGGSGLVFHTDEAFWRAQADPNQNLVDGWDTHEPGEEEAETEGFRDCPLPQLALHDGAKSPRARTRVAGARQQPRSGLGVARARPVGHRAAGGAGLGASGGTGGAPLNASNLGWRILERMGWQPDRPGLGKRRCDASVLPLAVQLACTRGRRRGLA
jgi:hypothetical protein